MSEFDKGWAERLGQDIKADAPALRKKRHPRKFRPNQTREAGMRGSRRGQIGAKLDRVLGKVDEG